MVVAGCVTEFEPPYFGRFDQSGLASYFYTMRSAKVVSLYEAKTHLSEFIERAAKGEEFIVSKSGKPKARILPLAKTNAVRLGVWKGKVTVSKDFDDPLPDVLLEAFGELPE